MDRARCAQGSSGFGISDSGAARLSKETGQPYGSENQPCDAPLEIETANLTVRLHFSHSNVPVSKPGSLDSMQESFIGLAHLAHGKTPISATLNSGSV
jgi:hypothetical protein